MAGASLPTPSSSKRKTLDAEINLVPFIDLLSVSICFLLMTAVWVQIGSVEVKQAHGTDAPVQQQLELELELKFLKANTLSVSVRSLGKTLKTAEFKGTSVETMLTQLDGGIIPLLAGGSVASARLTPADGVPYGSLISVMDVLRKHQIVNLGVVPVGG